MGPKVIIGSAPLAILTAQKPPWFGAKVTAAGSPKGALGQGWGPPGARGTMALAKEIMRFCTACMHISTQA